MKCAWYAVLLAMTCGGLFGCESSSDSVDTVTLSSASGSGETGTATLTSISDSTTQVAITTSGGTDTGVQAAAIYSGTCGSGGTIFAQLNNVQGQSSVTTIDSELSSLTGSKYYIDVSNSDNVDDIMTCGEIP